METVITMLGQTCKALEGVSVHYQVSDMLVSLPTENGRRQTVRVWTKQVEGGQEYVLRLQSRACLVTGHRVVRDALLKNAEVGEAALALDASVDPPALDVMASLIVEEGTVDPNRFLNVLYKVGWLADRIENAKGQVDRF